ncbi:MAG: sulfatase [Planctomycetota bacterium]|nr:sulfatase [Planctomycetota bacterium]
MRRIPNASVGLCVLATALLGCGDKTLGAADANGQPIAEAQAEPGPVSVILISLDTLRADRLGCYGYDRGTSPFLDSIAAQGARFTSASAPSSKTATSHMSMLSGFHPTVHGVRNCYTPDALGANPGLPMLAEYFEDVAYKTAAFTGGGMMTHELGFDRGFDIYDDAGGGADRVFPKAANWLKEYAAQEGGKDDPTPFFLLVHTYEIHDPYTPPASFQERLAGGYQGGINSERIALPEDAAEVWKMDPEFYKRVQDQFWDGFDGRLPGDIAQMSNLYDAGIAYTDSLLSELWKTVQELGLDSEVLLVITSDHGEEFGDHNGMSHQTIYEEILHVPLIVRWPGKVAPGLVLDNPVQGVDLTPSLVELAGIPFLGEPQGASWANSLSGETVEWNTVWAELGTPNNELASLKWGRYKLIGNREKRDAGLFDLRVDPKEKFNSIQNFEELGVHLSDLMYAQEAANQALSQKFPPIKAPLGAAAKGAMDALGYTDGAERDIAQDEGDK